jgi:REP element-mobilizing transposase RayT
MPRAARLDIPGILQHVIVRGVERRDIFLDDEDRVLFLERFSSLLGKTETRCFAWALLSNHCHFLLMPTSFPLSLLMRRLLTGHAVVINRKYRRTGHLFQNRYKSIVCEEEPYLLELVRYIHLNPLRAGLVANLEELDRYPWCGHGVLMGNRKLDGQAAGEVLERFGKSVSRARRNYRQFIADGISLGSRADLVGGGLLRSQGERGTGEYESFDERILGSGSFVDRLKEEEELREKIGTRLSLSELIERVCLALEIEPERVKTPSKSRAPSEARGVICFLAVRDLGYKGKEVGRELHLGPTGVSVAVRRGEKALQHSPELRNRMLSY